MSKMIKKEFTPASQISAAFRHYRKASKKKNKILHDISQKQKGKNVNFKEISVTKRNRVQKNENKTSESLKS